LELECPSSSLALERGQNLAIRSPRSAIDQPKAWLPFTTRHLRCHRRVRSGPFIGATPSSSLGPDLKTSFSRSNPVPRGQATAISRSVR